MKAVKEGVEGWSKAIALLKVADVGLPISTLLRKDIEVP